MAQVKMYTKLHCPYCVMAKQLLNQLGVNDIEEIRVDLSPDDLAEMQNLTQRRTVPQIFIGKTHVGGFTDMQALHQQGGLQELLNQE